MKNTVKRLLACLLCALMIPLPITSCTSDETPDDTSASTTTTAVKQPDPEPVGDPNWVSAIFGGGPFVKSSSATVRLLKRSDYNTIMLWSVHVNEDGDLVLNDLKVCEDGTYVGDPEWAEHWQELKMGTTSIKRIELSVGAWGCKDFENIKALIARDGTGEDTILYRNFKALIEAAGADAVNYDDESCYDVQSAVAFGKMCEDMGVKVTLCPYMNVDFWVAVKNQLGEELVDRVYLQCYSGGRYNNVADWERALGMKVIPGYWNIANASEGKTAAEVGEALKANKDSITGGFMWLFDEMRGQARPNSTRDYATAIKNAQFDD